MFTIRAIVKLLLSLYYKSKSSLRFHFVMSVFLTLGNSKDSGDMVNGLETNHDS